MVAAYPGVIPSFTTKVDQTDVNWAADINRLQDEIAAIAVELGTTPKAGFENVRERLQHLQATKSDVGHTHDERYIRRSLATSKGMIVASSTEGTFIGVDPPQSGEVLTGDPDQPSGVRWRTLSHGQLPGLANDDHLHYLTTDRHSGTDHTGILSQISIKVFLDVLTSGDPGVGDVLKWNGEVYAPSPDNDTKAHGSLTGLESDHHTQYFNAARHNNRALHDAIGLTHNSLTGLTTGNPHSQYPRKSSTETITHRWTFDALPEASHPTLGLGFFVYNPDGGQRIFVRSSAPPVATNGDIWIRP